jgi:hypothetical protein
LLKYVNHLRIQCHWFLEFFYLNLLLFGGHQAPFPRMANVETLVSNGQGAAKGVSEQIL